MPNSLTWSWSDYWIWFENIPKEYKTYAMQELNKGNWLAQLPAEIQINVMEDAPVEILKSMKYFPSIFKSETIEVLGE